MNDHYQLLETIYEVVKNDAQPEKYACKPRELILRRLQEWSVIYAQLLQLEAEEMVQMEQQDTLIVRITASGIEKIRSENNLVNN